MSMSESRLASSTTTGTPARVARLVAARGVFGGRRASVDPVRCGWDALDRMVLEVVAQRPGIPLSRIEEMLPVGDWPLIAEALRHLEGKGLVLRATKRAKATGSGGITHVGALVVYRPTAAGRARVDEFDATADSATARRVA